MTLDEKADEAAQNARCTRCENLILQMPVKEGISTGRARTIATGDTVHFSLCGPCGRDLATFLRWFE